MVHCLEPSGILRKSPDSPDILDPSIQFGAGGAFETIRIEARRPHLLHAHQRRLRSTMSFLKLRPAWDVTALGKLILAEMDIHPDNAMLRLRLTVGAATWPSGPGRFEPGIRAFAHAVELPPPVRIPIPDRPPLALHVFRDYSVASDDHWRRHKTTRYYAEAEARRRAWSKGFDEALLLNGEGMAVEGSAHNLIWVKGMCLCYPTPELGALPGTFAAWVKEVAPVLGFELQPEVATPSVLESADAILLTNSIGEIRVVDQLDASSVSRPAPGSPAARLLEYAEQTREARAEILTPQAS